jgi:hypothetical protein
VGGTATSATVGGLTSGTAYTFTIQASNTVGTGPASAASGAVMPTPGTVPAAPQSVTAAPASNQAQVSWSAPATNGGTAISSYTITPYLGTTAQPATTVSGSTTTKTVTGLTNSSAYTFKVTAINSTGTSAASAASPAVTPVDTIFDFSGTPVNVDTGDQASIEVGLKFTADAPGLITGVRFYKTSTNTGTHTGSLWTAGGTLLASATFTNETGSGWQYASFSSPVSISANTTYVVGYFAPNGHYSSTMAAFGSAVDNPPLHALSNGTSANGVYAYSATSTFPASSYDFTNYWVDVMYAPPTPPGQVAGVSATAQPGAASVSWTAPSSGGPVASYTITPYIGTTAQPTTTAPGTATSATVAGLTAGTSYTFTVQGSNTGGPGPVSASSNAVTPQGAVAPGAPTAVSALPASAQAQVSWTAPSNDGGATLTGYRVTPYLGTAAQTPVTVNSGSATSAIVNGLTNGSAYTFKVAAINAAGTGADSTASPAVTPEDTIFDFSGAPVNIDTGDTASTELGVKFSPSTDGAITGLRFYKAAANAGTHIGTLWTLGGTQLASATFTGESASGWQYVSFSTPVTVTAGTTYVAAYLAPKGHYSSTMSAFGSPFTTPPLQAIGNGASQNGVYSYSATTTFPTNSYQATNYWVDVMFAPATAPGQVTGVTATAQNGAAGVSWTAPSGSPVTSYTVTPYTGGAAQTPTTVTGAPAATNVTVNGLTPGTSYTFVVAASNSAGNGPASAASNAVTPTGSVVAPSAPTGVSASPATSEALVSWTAPSNNGGSAISSYTITPYIGSTAQTPVQVNGGSATSATVTGLTNGTAYTFTVAAANSAGAGIASAVSPAVTPAATILDFAGSPVNVDSGDTSATTLGVKFTANVNGSITGIRFYKAATNTGTHVGTLWSSAGTQLATATFTNETASGWQQVYFSTPVSVTAGTTYVASYFAPSGHYSSTPGGFNAAVTNGPLQTVASGTSPNGVYAYGAGNTFPSSSFNSTNYWVDVFFTTP